MRRLLLILCFLLLSVPSHAQILTAICGGGSGVVCGGSLHEDALGTDLSLWTSETDPHGEGAISGGYYVITNSGDADNIYLTKTLGSSYNETWARVTVNFSDVTAVLGASQSVVFINFGFGVVKFTADGSGNITILRVTVTNDAFGSADASYTISPALQIGTDYTVKVRYWRATTTESNDGGMAVYWNGASSPNAQITNSDNNGRASHSTAKLGVVSGTVSGASTWSFKNWEWREDDCFD